MAVLTGILLVVIGLIACFAGKKLYRIVLALVGFVIGFYVVSGLLVGQSDIVVIAASIFGGIVFAAVLSIFYKFAYILYGVSLGLTVAVYALNTFNLEGIVGLIITVVLAVTGGVIGGLIGDLMIRVATAFAGASQVIGGVAALATALGVTLPLIDPTHGSVSTDSTAGVITVIAMGILGVLGYIVQTRNDTSAVL